MRDYRLSRDYVLLELPVIEGRALWSWARLSDGLLPVDMVSDGYVAQEVERLKT